MAKIIVYTDLDGTLLDYATYSFQAALPALSALRDRGIPLVLCSSKTRAELKHMRIQLENAHPFVSENGGGIFIPEGYFTQSIQMHNHVINSTNGLITIRLGASYPELRDMICRLRRSGFPVRGFGDMGRDELTALTGLRGEDLDRALQRDFDEPFLFEGDPGRLHDLIKFVTEKGLQVTEGRFFHLLGRSNKGTAVAILTDLYRREFGDLFTVALGDSPLDVPMLARVDCPIIVQRHDGTYDKRIILPRLLRADGIGPEGWNNAIMKLLRKVVTNKQ